MADFVVQPPVSMETSTTDMNLDHTIFLEEKLATSANQQRNALVNNNGIFFKEIHSQTSMSSQNSFLVKCEATSKKDDEIKVLKAPTNTSTSSSLSSFSSSPSTEFINLSSSTSALSKSNDNSPERRGSNRLKDKEKKNYMDHLDEDPLIIEDDSDEERKDAEAAISADLPPDDLSSLEERELPQIPKDFGAFVQVRNHVLGIWQNNVFQYLSLQDAQKGIQEKYKCMIPPAFQFLERFGFINTGVLQSPNLRRDREERIIVIGAGMSGLAAARQLHSFGYKVTILEARDRIGGRTNTDSSLGVDLGASIITGLEGNPLTNLCKQIKAQLHQLTYSCPIYDTDGKRIREDIDNKMEKEFNRILDESSKQRWILPENLSLGDAVMYLLGRTGLQLSDTERQVFHWHIANLEYACAAELKYVSLQHWDQDDGFEWAGAHCLLKEGYSSITRELAKGLDIRLNCPVQRIEYSEQSVKIFTPKETFVADKTVVTLPLGVLKHNSVTFSPPLPEWKTKAIDRLGFGLLNKVHFVVQLQTKVKLKIVLRFPYVFWEDHLDYFGQTNQNNESRGEHYMFWNLHRAVGKPILIALMAGKAAYIAESLPDDVIIGRVISSLSQRFGKVPQPLEARVTRWANETYTKGSYSYVAVGASGEDYDLLAKPIDDKLFFAGEATMREHPATAAGAYLSGLLVAGLVDKSLNGNIKLSFNINELVDEWKKERLSEGTRHKKRRWDDDDEDEERIFQRGKKGLRVKKTKLNESYSWLFTSTYRIPKRKPSETDSNSHFKEFKPVTPQNFYSPSEYLQRSLDMLPKARSSFTSSSSSSSSSSASSSSFSPSSSSSAVSSVSPVIQKPKTATDNSSSKQTSTKVSAVTTLQWQATTLSNSSNKSSHSNHSSSSSSSSSVLYVTPPSSSSSSSPQPSTTSRPATSQVSNTRQFMNVQQQQPMLPSQLAVVLQSQLNSSSKSTSSNVHNAATSSLASLPSSAPSVTVQRSPLQPVPSPQSTVLQQMTPSQLNQLTTKSSVDSTKSGQKKRKLSINPEDRAKLKELKAQISALVVKRLSKFMKQGRISSKEDFKHLARKLTHHLMDKEKKFTATSGKVHPMSDHIKQKVKKYIETFFQNQTGATTTMNSTRPLPQ